MLSDGFVGNFKNSDAVEAVEVLANSLIERGYNVEVVKIKEGKRVYFLITDKTKLRKHCDVKLNPTNAFYYLSGYGLGKHDGC